MAKTLNMSYTLNTDRPWIYCNYPENFPAIYVADKGYYINRQSVSAGTGQLFYEHSIPNLAGSHYHGIRVYNGNSSSVTFKILNYGHANRTITTENWESAQSWMRFWQNNNAATYTIQAKKSIWICEESIPGGTGLFTGNLRFNTSAPVVIATYIYQDKSRIPDSTKCIPYSPQAGVQKYKVYSGLGNGYYFTAAQKTIKVSEFPSGDGIIKFKTHTRDNTNYSINGVDGKIQHEFIPLKLVSNPNLVAEYNGNTENDPLHNLGNWCAQYYFPFVFTNDSNKAVTIKCRVQCKSTATSGAAMPIINCNGSIYRDVQPASSGKYLEWKTITIPAGSSTTLNYQFVLGANSLTNIEHQFILQK